MPTTVELQRRRASDQVLIAWNLNDDGTDPVLDAAVLAKLELVRAILAGTVNISGMVAISNLPATQPVSGAISVNNFPATQPVSLAAISTVKDDYQTGECLADQAGSNGVLTFTFASARNLVVVEALGSGTQVARCDPFGGTPTVSLGMHCDDGVPTYIPVTTTVVKVFAPSGMSVSVTGFSRV